MQKSKLVVITVIIIVCVVLVAVVYNSVFKEESSLNKTYTEVYEGLTEDEQNMLKDKYKEMQNSENIEDKFKVDVELPEAVKEKLYPDVFTKPFKDFLNTK